MSRVAKTTQKVMGLKAKFMPKPQPSPYMEFEIKANQVTPAPPLGPELGERGVNVAQFCKDINAQTAHIIDGVPLDVKLWVNADRTYKMIVDTPKTEWLIMVRDRFCIGGSGRFSWHIDSDRRICHQPAQFILMHPLFFLESSRHSISSTRRNERDRRLHHAETRLRNRQNQAVGSWTKRRNVGSAYGIRYARGVQNGRSRRSTLGSRRLS